MCVWIVHIQASFNNTIVTITDPVGNRSVGKAPVSGLPRLPQGIRFAAQQAARMPPRGRAITACVQCDVRVAGPGSGRESGLSSALAAAASKCAPSAKYAMPHNGCVRQRGAAF